MAGRVTWQVVGVPPEDMAVKDFALPGKYLDNIGTGADLTSWPMVPGRCCVTASAAGRGLKVGRCTVCGACAQACPGEAIEMDKAARVALVDDEKCIQCFCCHEVCPNAAIDLEFTGIGRLMHGLRLV